MNTMVEIVDANGNPMLVIGGVDPDSEKVYVHSVRVLTPHGVIDVDEDQIVLIRYQYSDILRHKFKEQGGLM